MYDIYGLFKYMELTRKKHHGLAEIPKAVESAVTFSKTIIESIADRKKRDKYGPFSELFAITQMPVRYQQIVLDAMAQMETSKDPFHGASHPARMAHDLLRFIKNDPSLISIMDMQALILAIPLHDLSRAQQQPTLYGAIYGMVTEKKYAVSVAREFLLTHGMDQPEDKECMERVLVAVNEHTLANTFDRKSLESQWLYGLDCLDVLSQGRLEELDRYAKKLAEYWLFRPAMMWYKNSFVAIAKEFRYYGELIEKEAKKRQPKAIEHLQKLQKKMKIPGKLKF